MPLTAVADGKTVTAFTLDDEAWEELRSAEKAGRIELRSRCCSGRLKCRTSPRGTRHFYHHEGRADCATARESWQHLLAKEAIARAALAVGWTAEVESRGDGWQADVLCRRGERAVAFEVQWSRQDVDTTTFRTDRYETSGVETVWLLRNLGWAKHDVPAATLAFDETAPIVSFGAWDRHKRPLGEFVGDFLTGRLSYRPTIFDRNPGTILVEEFLAECWRCHTVNAAFRVTSPDSCCGGGMQSSPSWNREVGERLQKAQRQGRLRRQGAYVLDEVYSKTIHERYIANVCPKCRSFLGDFFVPRMERCACKAACVHTKRSLYAFPCTGGEVRAEELLDDLDVEFGGLLTAEADGFHWCSAQLTLEQLGWTPPELEAKRARQLAHEETASRALPTISINEVIRRMTGLGSY